MCPWYIDRRGTGYLGTKKKLYKVKIVIPEIKKYDTKSLVKTIYDIRKVIKLFRVEDYYFEPSGSVQELLDITINWKNSLVYNFICDRRSYKAIIELRKGFDFDLKRAG